MTNMIIKFDPSGRVALLLGRKAESERIPNPAATGPAANPEGGGGAANRGLPGAGAQPDLFYRPTDVAWDSAGNIYISDGTDANNNARIAKFDKAGKFIKSWGSLG